MTFYRHLRSIYRIQCVKLAHIRQHYHLAEDKKVDEKAECFPSRWPQKLHLLQTLENIYWI